MSAAQRREAVAPRSWLSMTQGADPAPETDAQKVRRMADLIRRSVTASGSITRDELVVQFGAAAVDSLYRRAVTKAGVHRLGETI